MTITRITTQGLYNLFRDKRSWVISYMLEYSTDGRQWMKYVDTTTDLDNTVVRVSELFILKTSNRTLELSRRNKT